MSTPVSDGSNEGHTVSVLGVQKPRGVDGTSCIKECGPELANAGHTGPMCKLRLSAPFSHEASCLWRAALVDTSLLATKTLRSCFHENFLLLGIRVPLAFAVYVWSGLCQISALIFATCKLSFPARFQLESHFSLHPERPWAYYVLGCRSSLAPLKWWQCIRTLKFAL